MRLTCRGFVPLGFYVLSGDDGKRDSLLFPAHRMTRVSRIFEVLGPRLRLVSLALRLVCLLCLSWQVRKP